MKAMIFAAGLGTRLQPLTNSIPKALVPFNNKPLLQHLIEKLVVEGFDKIIINTHHFSEQLIDFINIKNSFGIHISISDETGTLLDTGGGLIKASWFFDDGKPFLVHNVDVVSNIDFSSLLKFHIENNAIATLAVRDRKTSRYLHFDDNNALSGWENIKTGERLGHFNQEKTRRFAFSGIHVIDPKIFKLINEEGKFSIINVYLNLANENKIVGFDHSEDLWMDVGNLTNLKKAEELFP